MKMSIKMLPVIADAQLYIAYKQRLNENSSDVIDRQTRFWELDKEESKYLIQELKRKGIWKGG